MPMKIASEIGLQNNKRANEGVASRICSLGAVITDPAVGLR